MVESTFMVEHLHLHTCLGWVVVLLLCSHSHNDVPPEPQRNVSMAAVWGPSTCLGYSNVVFIM